MSRYILRISTCVWVYFGADYHEVLPETATVHCTHDQVVSDRFGFLEVGQRRCAWRIVCAAEQEEQVAALVAVAAVMKT